MILSEVARYWGQKLGLVYAFFEARDDDAWSRIRLGFHGSVMF